MIGLRGRAPNALPAPPGETLDPEPGIPVSVGGIARDGALDGLDLDPLAALLSAKGV